MSGIRFELIRHGQTVGNLEKRYIGRTDEDLCPEGVQAAAGLADGQQGNGMVHSSESSVYWWVSPMRRCLETACLAAGIPAEQVQTMINEGSDARVLEQCLRTAAGSDHVTVIDALRECDFGLFEGKNWRELTGNAAYQTWIDSGGRGAFPQGEDPAAFQQRCAQGFADCARKLAEEKQEDALVKVVVHGGTIMSIMDSFAEPQDPPRGYFDWQVKNAARLTCSWDGLLPMMLRDVTSE